MKMKLATIMSIALATAGVSTTFAASVKKNCPSKKEVAKILEEIGPEHMPERMKVYEIGSIKVEQGDETSYFHAFSGTLKLGGYRIIIFDNTPTYLGFYTTDYEPSDYEEGAVIIDAGDGETTYKLPIPFKGPSASAAIGGIPTKFTKNPKLEAKAKATDSNDEVALVIPEKQKSETGEIIDYRDWKITMKGKEITVNAIFVRIDKSNVIIKSAKTGTEATVPGNALSNEDKEYVKKITATK